MPTPLAVREWSHNNVGQLPQHLGCIPPGPSLHYTNWYVML